MLAPHELKNKDFSKSLRGYSTVEVDEHIDFLIEKYTELYRENDQLEKKLRLTEAQLDALRSEEESIRSTLINAQKASARIIDEANERADIIMRSAKNSYEGLIAELKANVKTENDKLRAIQKEIAVFKAALFAGYQSHIEIIEQIAPEVKIEDYDEAQAEELSEIVLGRIKSDLAGKKAIISGSDDGFTDRDDDETEALDEESVNRTSSELNIPDELISEVDEEENYESIRDDGEELVVEREQISGGSIIDSIKKLNDDAKGIKSNSEDDEEFLRMLNKASADSSDDFSSTDEFDIVYNGNKRK